jgi:hypothetical protein
LPQAVRCVGVVDLPLRGDFARELVEVVVAAADGAAAAVLDLRQAVALVPGVGDGAGVGGGVASGGAVAGALARVSPPATKKKAAKAEGSNRTVKR